MVVRIRGLQGHAAALILCGFASVSAHVALTFPPARKYDFDFLDTFRTVLPCGMQKDPNRTTLVEAGKPLNVTWHLGYPHNGGVKIELLDAQDKKIMSLTPQGKYVGAKEDQRYEVQIPEDLTCPSCSIRLVRQALEWGKKYQFQSCADIHIVPYEDYYTQCGTSAERFGNTKSGGKCDCKRTYFGNQCQYKNDCEDDTDCGGESKGKCIDHGGSSLPKKQCFCRVGFFGQNCERESALKDKRINASAEWEEILLNGNDYQFMWRFVGGRDARDEVEVVLNVSTTSYVALGWRPNDVTKSCKKEFPADALSPVDRTFHPMDCQDIVIGMAKGDLSNVGDYYTRDRSTPRRDSVYGGKDDLTAAVGWEEDGRTVVMFRKPVAGSRDAGKSDHNFEGLLKVIWAYGQAGVDFYKEDEIKYHGGNRGHTTLELSGPVLGQEKILLITAMAILLFVLLVQAAHKLIADCCGTPKNDNELIMKHMKG